jgi:uncharacterized protein YyaL (SSP411 family)
VNHLAAESSPYLQMHVHNPVDWYPWGEEALKKAASEDKPILLSIGYTACHWCHVMAQESFEDTETAALMNSLFINIKVDREERLDLDKIYQLSAQLLTRQPGGWPLTIFLMPKTHIPFFAGTYFPKVRLGQFPAFSEVLNYVAYLFKQRKNELIHQNSTFINVIKELESQGKLQSADLSLSPILKSLAALRSSYDKRFGGFGSAPKFPVTTYLEFLRINSVSHEAASEEKEMLLFTLRNMIQGGIYDQIGKGFFRYSVDERWHIPHFEKMLYDNSLILALLVETFACFASHPAGEKSQQFQNSLSFLVEAISGTADWIINELQSEAGGFYASFSADTQGREGAYYVWTRDEIKSLVSSEEFDVINLFYGLHQAPNFQKKWHLIIRCAPLEIAKELGKGEHEVNRLIKSAQEKLYAARRKRLAPKRDEKIIVSWNGLTIKALSLAGFYLNNRKYSEAAKNCFDFIRENLWKGNQLFSVYKEGEIKQPANLDDFIFLIEGIVYLLQDNWSTDYLNFLRLLQNKVIELFEDKEAGGFYFTSTLNEELFYRLKQYTDESLPSSNAIGTRLCLQLGYFLGDNALLQSAEKSLKNAYPHLERYPDGYCSFLITLAYFFSQTQIIIVRGDLLSLDAWQQVYKKYFTPNRLVFFVDSTHQLPPPLDQKILAQQVVAYYCIGQHCLAPLENLQEFEDALRSNQFRVKR